MKVAYWCCKTNGFNYIRRYIGKRDVRILSDIVKDVERVIIQLLQGVERGNFIL